MAPNVGHAATILKFEISWFIDEVQSSSILTGVDDLLSQFARDSFVLAINKSQEVFELLKLCVQWYTDGQRGSMQPSVGGNTCTNALGYSLTCITILRYIPTKGYNSALIVGERQF